MAIIKSGKILIILGCLLVDIYACVLYFYYMEFRDFTSRFAKEIILDRVNFLPATPRLSTNLHSHFNLLHIACIKKGCGICRVKGKIWKLFPGAVQFVMPGEIHRYVADEKNPYHAYFLHLNWYGSIPDDLPRQLTIPSRERKRVYKILQELSELFSKPGRNSELKIYGLFSIFLADVIRFSQEMKATPLRDYISGNSQDAKLNYVFEKLYGPPFEFPGIDELAEHCEISRRKFTALFRKLTGMSIKQYYLRNVMTYAGMMMESKELKITDIAAQCGYSNSQNFLHAYKTFSDRSDAPA
jgi:AraC-like DNA-binding protein